MNSSGRYFWIRLIFLSLIGIVLIKLFLLQVLDDSFKISAASNAIRKVKTYPARGIIMDRNQHILVQNQAIYDIMVIPGQVLPFDTGAMGYLLELHPREIHDRLIKARKYSRYRESLFEKQVTPAICARFQERIYEFPGFYVQLRTARDHTLGVASQSLGYTGEIDDKMLQHLKEKGYESGDFIGIGGIEQTYEPWLKGSNGFSHVLVDVHNRMVGSYADGEFDEPPVPGKTLTSTIDMHLQHYAEELLKGKKGSVVAIEPRTGEVLVMASAPGFDPDSLIGKNRGVFYQKLVHDPEKPLFNRATMAQYPPGSVFKIVQALVGQEMGGIDPQRWYFCPGFYRNGAQIVGCHAHPSPVSLKEAIRYSCNGYFCFAFKNMLENGSNVESQFNEWRRQVTQFGFGSRLGVDLPSEGSGLVPLAERYNRMYGKNRWGASTIISLGIGQGELGITPLQLANLMAILANQGYYFTPHLIRQDQVLMGNLSYSDTQRVFSDSLTGPIMDGLREVVESGTAAWVRIPNISICGKTGTVENPHGKDHSVFVAFAPMENPRIAIAVVIENSGFGGTWAAPTASLIIEKYLTGTVNRAWMEAHVKRPIPESRN